MRIDVMTEIHIGRQTFNVPCRRFSIRLTVSNKERLPLVKEFALKYLRVINRCNIEALQHYFGFTDREFSFLVTDLKDAGLIDMVGGDISLSDGGKKLFGEGDKQEPMIQSVEKWNEKFAIDFISFSIIHFVRRTDSYRCFHDLESADAEKVSRSRDIAKEVFAASFHEYVETYKNGISNEERAKLSIYGISSVESGDTFKFPLSVDFYVTPENPNQVNHRYPGFDSDAAQEKRYQIVHEVANAIETLKGKSKFGKDLSWLINENFGFSYFSEFMHGHQLDISSLLERIQLYRDDDFSEESTIPLVGAFFADENANLFMDLIRKSISDRDLSDDGGTDFPNEIFWQKPSNELWGREEETFSLISGLRREATSAIEGKSEINVIINGKYENLKQIKWRLTRGNNRNVFDHGYSISFGEEMAALEVFIWPGVIAGVLYNYLDSDDCEYPIPIGFLTRDKENLERLSSFLSSQWGGFGRKVQKVWPIKKSSSNLEEVKSGEVFSSILNQSKKSKPKRGILKLSKK